MKIFALQQEVWLPRPLGEVFPFFAEARNLEILTPPWLRFELLTAGQVEMKPGALIDYKLKLRGIPLRWQSEITLWEPPFRFIDEQRRGPYRYWLHEHRFDSTQGGTLARDVVHYAVPGGIASTVVNRLLAAPDLKKVFDYRRRKLLELFGDSGEVNRRSVPESDKGTG